MVPEKAHGKADCAAVETNPGDRHIGGMSAKSSDQAEPLAQQPGEKPAALPGDCPGDPPPPRPLPNPPPRAGVGRVGARPREIGGPKGPEPTRYGDWEVGGRCTD